MMGMKSDYTILKSPITSVTAYVSIIKYPEIAYSWKQFYICQTNHNRNKCIIPITIVEI